MNTWSRLGLLAMSGNLAVGVALVLVVRSSRDAAFADQPRLATIAVGLLVVQVLVNTWVLTAARLALRRHAARLGRATSAPGGNA